MDNKTIDDWIMYYEIQRLLRDGCGQAAVAKAINMDSRTAKRYTGMSEADFTALLEKRAIRPLLLKVYEAFVRDRLTVSPAASAAQVHDWLKESHPDFPASTPKTVYNFVMGIRQKYGIAKEEAQRQYFVAEELNIRIIGIPVYGHLHSWERRYAWPTPGGPKIYYDGFTFEIGQAALEITLQINFC